MNVSITDGLSLLGTEPWDGFRLWGTQEYDLCVLYGGPIFQPAGDDGLFPNYGSIPHLISVSILYEYLRTLIAVREAYGYEEGHPSDWWYPYATHGTRYDRE